MTAITNQQDAIKRGKEILHEAGYNYGQESIVLIGHKDNLWKVSALTTDMIDVELIIDNEGVLKKFETDEKIECPDGINEAFGFLDKENLLPNPGQFECKKCNFTVEENEKTCHNCDSIEFVQVKCSRCSSVDIALLIGGPPAMPGDSILKDIARGKVKFGWGCIPPLEGNLPRYYCNNCTMQW